ncbi:MAG: hypothetical protein U1F39_08835 [Steroidobacteraceae bacterium]
MSAIRTVSIVTRLIASAALAVAAHSTEAATAPSACTGEVYRAFDFWLGEWRVTAGGALAGHNRIESILGGCALLETWRGAKGGQGRSINAYDAGRGVWHQTWVDGHGEVLILEGGWHDGAMRLEGVQRTTSGTSHRARITWTPNDDHSVRQLWETSADDGRTWRVEFDGRYERAQ